MLATENKDCSLEIKGIEKYFIFNYFNIKVINVDPKKKPEENLKRTEIDCPEEYTEVVLYDHYTRKKN